MPKSMSIQSCMMECSYRRFLHHVHVISGIIGDSQTKYVNDKVKY